MGGIKNKLTKQLSNTTIPLSDYRLTSPFSQRGTKSSLPLAKGRQMSVAHRWGRITKYTSLACLTLAILSTLVLNIISSYSNFSTRSNAEPVSNSSASTLANTELDPTGISISISSYPSATGDTNDGNLSLSIPQGGGLVAGRHTVSVNAGGEVASYELYMHAADNRLVNTNTDGNIESSINSMLHTDITAPIVTALDDNEWGVAFPNAMPDIYKSNYEELARQPVDGSLASQYIFSGIPTSAGTLSMVYNGPAADGFYDVYYGVRVDHPESTPAGNYTAQVVYSVTAKLQEPVLTNIEPSTYELGSNESNTITITGKYLSTASKVYLTNTDTSADNSGTQYDCTNLQPVDGSDGTKLTCSIPTDTTSPAITEPGTYDLTVISTGGEVTKEDAITYTTSSICRNGDPDNDCQVDIDNNMIPVTYVGYDGNGGGYWAVVSDSDIANKSGSWYDYGKKQWANAVTVSNPSKYTSAATGTQVNNGDILGYWVYIPRYAYEVQRRDAVDARVSRQNFGIVFQTADEKNAPAPTKSTATNHLDYRTGNGISRTYVANSNNTTWATHPAFTWQYTRAANGFDKTYELNGIWVGKYETTGKRTAPTVKPNQVPVAGEYMGEFYTAAKSIAVNDPNNKGGNPVSGIVQNSHHLVKATSHMLKNSEWGAIVYLANSSYGAGLSTKYNHGYSNVKSNLADGNFSNDDADGAVGSGVTGCGPGDEWLRYGGGAILDATTIESPTACSENLTYAYNGSNGVLSSSTNTVYGVYGIAGGGRPEAVMGNRTTSATQTTNFVDDGKTTDAFLTPATPPYVDLYRSSDGFGVPTSWSSNTSGEYYYNFDVCTFKTCGGTATYEIQNWTSSGFIFVDLGENAMRGPWFERGGDTSGTNTDAVFMATTMTGDTSGTGTTGNYRVALIVN